jgi:hypothetical protein
MKLTLALLTFFSMSSYAATKIVDCKPTGPFGQAMISVKFKDHKMIQWNSNHLVDPQSHQAFYVLLSPIETEDGESFEWIKFFTARNGFQILEAGNTAEMVKLGIKIDPSKSGNRGFGFYEYTDLGSGNGHNRDSLNCLVK